MAILRWPQIIVTSEVFPPWVALPTVSKAGLCDE